MDSDEIFSHLKEENGCKFIDIPKMMEEQDLLSFLFHRKTIAVEKTGVYANNKNESRRYFEDKIICHTCGGMGHVSRECAETSRACMYCSISHDKRPCDFKFCDICQRLGHITKNCKSNYPDFKICKRCKHQNHYSDECPEYWRFYKLKKSGHTNQKVIKSCPFCHSETHFMDDCDKKERTCTIFTLNYMLLIRNNKISDSNDKDDD